MTAKYTVIDSQVLATSAASVTFSSIPGGYKDLILVTDVLAATGSGNIAPSVRFNGDSGANYAYVFMRSNASSAGAPDTNQMFLASGAQADETNRGLYSLEVFDYNKTDKHKSAFAKGVVPADEFYYFAHRWANTNAITSLEIFANISVPTDEFAATSTFRLLGVN